MTDVPETESHGRRKFRPGEYNGDIKSMSTEMASSILKAMLSTPLPWAQVCVPGLEKYTQQQLEYMFHAMLIDPPPLRLSQIDFEPVPWEVDEDFIIFSYFGAERSDCDFDAFLEKFGAMLHPIRSKEDIKRRVAEISSLSAEEHNEIVEKFAKKTVLEERFYRSSVAEKHGPARGLPLEPHVEQCVCINSDPVHYTLNPDVDGEIAELETLLPTMTSGIFAPNDLAVLRGESLEFHIKNRIVKIGRYPEDSIYGICLIYLNDKACRHISREQASLQLMYDGKFYLENIGNGILRVNGRIITPKQYCVVPPGAILDFSSVCMVFLPNHQLTNHLMKELEVEVRQFGNKRG
jgi:hypothetical protein